MQGYQYASWLEGTRRVAARNWNEFSLLQGQDNRSYRRYSAGRTAGRSYRVNNAGRSDCTGTSRIDQGIRNFANDPLYCTSIEVSKIIMQEWGVINFNEYNFYELVFWIFQIEFILRIFHNKSQILQMKIFQLSNCMYESLIPSWTYSCE